MIEKFQQYICAHASLTEEELERVYLIADERVLKRNELLLTEGEICRHKTFIVSGMLRTFGTSDDGSEHILQFSTENNWALDAESYDKLAPSRFNIAAVERSQLLMWSKPDFDRLLHDIPALKSLAERLISRAIYTGRHRLLTALSATPEQKYIDFVQEFPSLVRRLPLHMIAAYLGISLKTLTRIRRTQIVALSQNVVK